MPLLVLTLICYYFVTSSCETDAEILIDFKNSLTNSSALYNWNPDVSPCNLDTPNWIGLRCNNDSSIDKLLLESMGLTGRIDIDILVGLPKLRTISFMNNALDGPMPPVKKLTSLKNLYLSNNRFSGKISGDAFAGMNSLKEVYLANNQFVGEIPKSLAALPKLSKLSIEGNQFEGKIPDFKQDLSLFNAANNHLDGQIPASLAKFDASSFAGNKGLCGKPLLQCKSSKKKKYIIIGVIAAAVLALAAIVVLGFICGRGNKKTQSKQAQETRAPKKFMVHGMGPKAVVQSPPDQAVRKEVENGKLHFVRYDRDRFELQDLLRASAEVLGSGTFGSSYKAVLLNGPAMVVKRFRHMTNVGKEEFHEHMRRLGTLSHPNLLPLVAYYYRKEEKLLVSDFIENGSLASHLHGKRAPGQAGLDWPTRLKIIKGVAQGLAYLYKEFPNFALPHGHLKSANILLDHTFVPLLADYALVPVSDKDHAQEVMVAYKSPEFTKYDRTTRKTDVWCLGILILEMLTGKFPANYLKQGKGPDTDLATWVNSVVREEWTGEVFDKDMKGTKNGEGEMLKLLKIGMCCCEWNVERRWDLKEAVVKIEELKERDNDVDDYSSYN
ncbi:hypothetical protein Tsubulata_030870, partial [Turnera subulata]